MFYCFIKRSLKPYTNNNYYPVVEDCQFVVVFTEMLHFKEVFNFRQI